jgi:hypothetical protein
MKVTVVLGGLLIVVATGCPDDVSPFCTIDNDCKEPRVCRFGSCQDPSLKRACGEVVAQCGCYGLTSGQVVGALGCESGQAKAESCSSSCGQATLNRCFCSGGSVLDAGSGKPNEGYDCSGQAWASDAYKCSDGNCTMPTLHACAGSVHLCGGHSFYCETGWSALCCGISDFVPCPPNAPFPCFVTGSCVTSPGQCPVPNSVGCVALTTPNGC